MYKAAETEEHVATLRAKNDAVITAALAQAAVKSNPVNKTTEPGLQNKSTVSTSNTSPTAQQQNNATNVMVATDNKNLMKTPGANSSDTISSFVNNISRANFDTLRVNNPDSAANSETLKPLVQMKDSLSGQEPKKDTVVAKAPEAATPTPLFTPQMALIIEGGPNLPSHLSGTTNEKFPPTYSANLKFQYSPFKLLSFNAGLGYSNYSVSKPETDFVFDKNLTSDYVFNTAVGPLNMSKEDMLNGLFVQAPTPVFPAKYRYDAFINAVNVPIEAQFNFWNSSRFNIYCSAGVNTTYVISQRSHLSVIKEEVTNSVSFSDVKVNKLNYLMLFGLGADVKLKNNFYLRVAGMYKYSLTSLCTDAVNFKPNYLSAQVGLKYVLKSKTAN